MGRIWRRVTREGWKKKRRKWCSSISISNVKNWYNNNNNNNNSNNNNLPWPDCICYILPWPDYRDLFGFSAVSLPYGMVRDLFPAQIIPILPQVVLPPSSPLPLVLPDCIDLAVFFFCPISSLDSCCVYYLYYSPQKWLFMLMYFL